MATNDELSGSVNKLKIHQGHLQFLAIEMYKSKNKLNASFMWKTYKEEIYLMFTGTGYFPLNSKCKHLEIWNKLIKFQRKRCVEQCTNKDKKLKSIQEFRLLLKQSGNVLRTCSACKA